ncbi:ATP-dependent nuclease [Actinoplanes sp. CA-030573]|uniref:ATP-dependent nuclease n=1 Tax=Actinoplanes sp. CA-030573 TaxID=3239898 RepID=UPI003D8DC309
MQLRKVHIRNFRNFADLSIEPFPNPAVIVGENGVGKSNLLMALRLVLDPDLPDRRRWLQPDDIHDTGPSMYAGVEVSVQIELTDFDDDDDARSELDGAIVDTDPLIARLTYLFKPKKSLAAALGETEGDRLTPDDYEWTIFGADDPSNAMLAAKRYAALSVLPPLRDAEGDLVRADRSPLTKLLRELPPSDSNLEKALVAMQTARDELGQDPNVDTVRQMITDRVGSMAGPQLALSPSLAFAGRQEDLLRSIRLFTDAAGTRGIDRTSTGTANVLYLALLLERLRLRRESGNGEDALLAVEEPEAHLHPTLQRRVFAHLLKQPDRLILTTHSPHIAAVTPLRSLVLLSAEKGKTQASLVPPGLLEPHETTDIERYLNVTRAEMLFARRIVLVEGAAENFLIPALAEATGFDLDGHGVVVASVEGTDFAPYALLLGDSALRRPFVVLTDGDVTDSEQAHLAEPGLTRARNLLELLDAPNSLDFADKLKEVASGAMDGGSLRGGRADLVSDASVYQIYVGDHTLEVDIVPLMAREMVAAFNELAPSSPTRQSNFAAAVKEVGDAGGCSTLIQRKALLSKIERMGKGRYGQRLAAHVAAMDLRKRVCDLLKIDADAVLTENELLEVPGCGHLLTLLHDLRQEVEGLPLMPSQAEYLAWLKTREVEKETAEADSRGAPEQPKADK